MPKNIFVVISSPSGGGKDSIITKLVKIFPNSARLVTTTTRDPRPDDTEGVSYNFISKKEFKNKIKKGDFLEYNNYNGNYYGIDKKVLTETLSKNNIVFTNIDVNGRESLIENNIQHLAIFLLPENLDILEQRIKTRGGVTEKELKNRLKTAKKEIKMSGKYDYKVVNKEDKIDEAVEEIGEIIRGALNG